MKGPFSGVFLRTFCHATEDCAKVTQALQNAAGTAEVRATRTGGVHGNPIVVLEASLEDEQEIIDLFNRLRDDDLEALLATLAARIDEGCNLFFRIDKQEAFKGTLVLTRGEDVILVRTKVRAFPAKCELAQKEAREFLETELQRRARSV